MHAIKIKLNSDFNLVFQVLIPKYNNLILGDNFTILHTFKNQKNKAIGISINALNMLRGIKKAQQLNGVIDVWSTRDMISLRWASTNVVSIFDTTKCYTGFNSDISYLEYDIIPNEDIIVETKPEVSTFQLIINEIFKINF